MSKYLDNTGLAHFWGKIKEKINSEIQEIYDVPISYLQEDIDNIQTQLNGKFSVANINGLYFNNRSYINHHPENGGGSIIPFLYNDLGHLLSKGGSCTIYTTSSTDFTVESLTKVANISATANLFDGSPSYQNNFSSSLTAQTSGDTSFAQETVVIDITCHKTFPYSSVFYIDFGNTSWYCQKIQVLTNQSASNTTYTSRANVTNHSQPAYYVSFDLGATGFNRIRIVLKNPKKNLRIAQIGIINYGSAGVTETYVSRGGSALYGSLYPFKNYGANLGASSNQWANIYGNTIYEAGSSLANKYQAKGSYANSIHNHSISEVSGLQDELSGIGNIAQKASNDVAEINTVVENVNELVNDFNSDISNLYNTKQDKVIFDITQYIDSTLPQNIYNQIYSNPTNCILLYIDDGWNVVLTYYTSERDIIRYRGTYVSGEETLIKTYEIFVNLQTLEIYLDDTFTSTLVTNSNSDSSLSSTSTKPVQNKVVTNAINGKTSTSVIPNNSGDIKTKYRIAQKGDAGRTSGSYWYYKICDLPINNDGNYASAIISGRIGGWTANDMSYINALVWNRGTPGIALIDIAGNATSMSGIWNICDLVLYKNSSASATLYARCYSWFTFDLDLELFQSTGNITYDGTYITSTPSGELVAQASTSTKRLELVNGKLLVNGTSVQEQLVSGTNIKTINNQSILGSGNITIEGGSSDESKIIDLTQYMQEDTTGNGTMYENLISQEIADEINALGDKAILKVASKINGIITYFYAHYVITPPGIGPTYYSPIIKVDYANATRSYYAKVSYYSDGPAALIRVSPYEPSITADSSLSTTSTNPVQNKVVTTELNKKANYQDLLDLASNHDERICALERSSGSSGGSTNNQKVFDISEYVTEADNSTTYGTLPEELINELQTLKHQARIYCNERCYDYISMYNNEIYYHSVSASGEEAYFNSSDLYIYTENCSFTIDHYPDRYVQEQLKSGTNIKTINNQSILGSGNVSTSKFKILSRHTLGVNGYVDLLNYMNNYDELMIIVRAVPNATSTIGIGSTTSGSSNFLTSVSVSGTSYLKITFNKTDEDYFAWTIVGSGNNISSFGWTGSIGYQYLRNYTTGSSMDMSVVIHGR